MNRFAQQFLLIYCFLTLSVGSNANAQASGRLICTATKNIVLGTEEGKPKLYSGIQGKTKEGEKLNFTYKLSEHGAYLSLDNASNDKITEINAYISFSNKKTVASRAGSDNRGVFIKDEFVEATLSNDYIRLETLGGSLYLVRYYKTDWHGTFSNNGGPDLVVQVMTLNCRHINDQMEAAYKFYSKRF